MMVCEKNRGESTRTGGGCGVETEKVVRVKRLQHPSF